MSLVNNEVRSRWIEEISHYVPRPEARNLVIRIAGAKGLSNATHPKTRSEVEDALARASELFDEIIQPSVNNIGDDVKDDLLDTLEEKLLEQLPDHSENTRPLHVQLGLSKSQAVKCQSDVSQLNTITAIGDEARYGDENLLTDSQVDSLIGLLGSAPALIQRASSRTLFEISRAKPGMLKGRLDELSVYALSPSCQQYLVPAIVCVLKSDISLSADEVRDISEIMGESLWADELNVQYASVSALETIVEQEPDCIADATIDRLIDARNSPNPEVGPTAVNLLERLEEKGRLNTHEYRNSVPLKQDESGDLANHASRGPWECIADKDEDPSTVGMDPSMHPHSR